MKILVLFTNKTATTKSENRTSNDQVGLKRENEYIPIFEYILSFKDSSSYLEIGKSMQKIKL